MFRLWTAIHAIGAAAERRVWTQLGGNRLYPNLFIFLVGPPGTGKSQAIGPMSSLLRKSQATTLAPNDMTKQALLDVLGESARGTIIGGKPYDYHFVAVCISELSNFMSKFDPGLAGILTDLYDCNAVNEERKRGHDKGKLIVSPGLSFIMGTATQHLGSIVQNEMWGSGFMARVIMVFSDDEIIPEDMFSIPVEHALLGEKIAVGLRKIGDLKGPMVWDANARTLLHDFRLNANRDAPLHNRLTFYTKRRWMHLAKLCMVASLSDVFDSDPMLVTGQNVMTALQWLTDAEAVMPEIFKDMNSHEDGQIYEELRMAMFALHAQNGRRPIHASVVYKFLSGKASSNTVQRMVQIAEAAGFLVRVAGTEGIDAEYLPGSPGFGAGTDGVI